jgi:hypothetical protein
MMTTSTPEFEFLNTQAPKKPENHSYSERAEPSKRCLDQILNFSKNLEVQKSEQLGVWTFMRS